MAGSGSGCVIQRYESADPDPVPYQNVTDPQHWFSEGLISWWLRFIPKITEYGNITGPKVGEQAECVILARRLTIPSASVRLLAAISSTSVGLLAAARAQNRAAASQDGTAAAAQERRRGGGISWFDSGEEEIVGELGGGGRHTQVHQVGRFLPALRPVIGRRAKLSEPIGTLEIAFSVGTEKSGKQCAKCFYFSTC